MEQPDKISGPIFAPGPGWGFYVARWLNKYFWPLVLPAIFLLGLWLGARL